MKRIVLDWFWRSTSILNLAPVISGLTGLNNGYTYSDAESDLENNDPPQALSLSITGTATVGNTLTANFTFFSPSGYSAGTHLYQWYRAASDNTGRTAISGATNSTYVLTSSDEDSNISFDIIPVQTASSPANGNPQGAATSSPYVYVPLDLGNITYFGTSANPADNGTGSSSPITITPPASMQVGDLVIVSLLHRAIDGTFGVANAGGQTWTSHGRTASAIVEQATFSCIFDGTWDANPQFEKTGGVGTFAFTGVMHVFRPTDTGKTWTIDGSYVASTFTSGTAPFTKTIPSQVISNIATASLAGWHSGDDNTWGNLVGADWVTAGGDQYRNTSGSDTSCTFAYKIQYEVGSTGAVSKDQITLGGDGGVYFVITFYES